jgi:hypothetical protein
MSELFSNQLILVNSNFNGQVLSHVLVEKYTKALNFVRLKFSFSFKVQLLLFHIA